MNWRAESLSIGSSPAGEDPSYADSFAVLEFEELGSTNEEALRRIASGEHGPLWITAEKQTSGRGRSGRIWQSQAGNLAATLILSPGCTPRQLHQLALLTGVAAHDALQPFVAQAQQDGASPVRLKWPNDILAGHAKLGGILIESTMSGGVPVAAIGIGINVAAAPALDGRATVALASIGEPPQARDLLIGLDASLRAWLRIWQRGSAFGAIRSAWLQRAGPLGEMICVNTGSETICGAFGGIDETGALLVGSVPPTPDSMRRFTFGDVSLAPSSKIEGSN